MEEEPRHSTLGWMSEKFSWRECGQTVRAEPPRTDDEARNGRSRLTESAHRGRLRRIVGRINHGGVFETNDKSKKPDKLVIASPALNIRITETIN